MSLEEEKSKLSDEEFAKSNNFLKVLKTVGNSYKCWKYGAEWSALSV